MLNRPAKSIKPVIFTVFVTGLIISTLSSYSQNDPLKADYIKKYSELAVSEMRRSGIPASITMAQAILESDIGRSVNWQQLPIIILGSNATRPGKENVSIMMMMKRMNASGFIRILSSPLTIIQFFF